MNPRRLTVEQQIVDGELRWCDPRRAESFVAADQSPGQVQPPLRRAPEFLLIVVVRNRRVQAAAAP